VGCITVYLWSSFINWVWAKHVGAIDTQLSRQKYVRHRNRQLIGSIIFSLLFAIYLVTLSAN